MKKALEPRLREYRRRPRRRRHVSFKVTLALSSSKQRRRRRRHAIAPSPRHRPQQALQADPKLAVDQDPSCRAKNERRQKKVTSKFLSTQEAQARQKKTCAAAAFFLLCFPRGTATDAATAALPSLPPPSPPPLPGFHGHSLEFFARFFALGSFRSSSYGWTHQAATHSGSEWLKPAKK